MGIATELDSPLGRTLVAAADPLEPLTSTSALLKAHPEASPELVRAALTQAALVARAGDRFPGADRLLWTSDGLEQASRPAVSTYRAARLVAAGVRHVVDLTCGLGLDALACAAAGLQVTAVEVDPVVAERAALNARRLGLSDRLSVIVGSATDPDLLTTLPSDAWFVDPARRGPTRRADGSHRRLDDPQAWAPPWSWVRAQIGRPRLLMAKAAPGIDHTEVAGSDSEWISHRGELLEVCCQWDAGMAESRAAVLLDDTGGVVLRVRADGTDARISGPPAPGAFLLDPDPAIVRAGAVTDYAALVGGTVVDEHLAYVVAHVEPSEPLRSGARVWRAVYSGPYDPPALRRACGDAGLTRVDVTGRGRRLDPGRVRKDLALPGGAGLTGVLAVMAIGPARTTSVTLGIRTG